MVPTCTWEKWIQRSCTKISIRKCEKHDAGQFLWKNVVGATSVKDVLLPIEPPYPGYQRTLVALQKYLQMAKDEVPDPLPQVTKPVSAGPGV